MPNQSQDMPDWSSLFTFIQLRWTKQTAGRRIYPPIVLSSSLTLDSSKMDLAMVLQRRQTSGASYIWMRPKSHWMATVCASRTWPWSSMLYTYFAPSASVATVLHIVFHKQDLKSIQQSQDSSTLQRLPSLVQGRFNPKISKKQRLQL